MKKKSVLFCLLAVLTAGLSVFLLVRGSQGSGAFRGSFVKNSDSYLLNAERMTGTDTHTLALQKVMCCRSILPWKKARSS